MKRIPIYRSEFPASPTGKHLAKIMEIPDKVAGMRGNPCRGDSHEYYIIEPMKDNDPKGVELFKRHRLNTVKID